MAKKYIDAEKARYLLIEIYDCHCPDTINGDLIRRGIYESAEVLNNMPAADVEPVIHAKWESTELMHENGCTRCSECKTEYCVSNLKEIGGDTLPLYCPNCGALMDGES